MDEILPVSSRTRFRRIPLELLPFDPRESNYRWLFDVPLGPDQRPNLVINQEVEIQWRLVYSNPWSWWRGTIAALYINPQSLSTIASVVEPGYTSPNVPIATADLNMIKILHPQFPHDSAWRATYVSPDGIILPTEPMFGQVGGVRAVECVVHTMLWKLNFEFLFWGGDVEGLDLAGLGIVDPYTLPQTQAQNAV